MTIIAGGVRVGGFISPTDSTDTYPVTKPIYGLGGLRTVADHTARNAIANARCEEGMQVYTISDGKLWQLANGFHNPTVDGDWIDITLASENYWDRTGTVLSTHTSGDSLSLTGDLTVTGSSNDNAGTGATARIQNSNAGTGAYAVLDLRTNATGSNGGQFFGSNAALNAYGIVSGITFGPANGTQDIGFRTGSASIGGGTGTTNAMIIKSTGLVGIGTLVAGPSAMLHVLSNQADGASTIASVIDTSTAWSTTGAKLLSLKNNNVSKFYVDYAGAIFPGGQSTYSWNGYSLTTDTVYSVDGYYGSSTKPMQLYGYVTDGATAIAAKVGNVNALSTTGAKIMSFYSDSFSTEKSFVDIAGTYHGNVNSTKITNLTTNGFVKTSGSDGTLSVDTASYAPLTSPSFTTPTLGVFTASAGSYVGPTTIAHWSGAALVASHDNTGMVDSDGIGIVGEASAGVSLEGYGVYGIGKVAGSVSATGVFGKGKVTADGNYATCYAGRFDSTDNHSGGVNIAVYAIAANGASSYSFYADSGAFYNGGTGQFTDTLTLADISTPAAQDWDLLDNNASALSFDTTGKAGILEIDTTNSAECIRISGNFYSGGNTVTNVPNARIVGATNLAGVSWLGNIGVVGGGGASNTGYLIGVGVLGTGRTDGTYEGFGIKGSALIKATGDTATAYGAYLTSTGAHAGGDNIGVYSNASNGLITTGIYGVATKATVSGSVDGDSYAVRGHADNSFPSSTATAYGGYFVSDGFNFSLPGTRTNIGVYASGTNYSFYGAAGNFYNAGNAGIGSLAFDATGTQTLLIGNGTAPAAHVDNAVQVYSVDSSDATATLGLMLEQATAAIGVTVPTTKIKIKVNGTEYFLLLSTV